MRPDYYELLDISPKAGAAEVKAAYYRQAKKYHPDRNRGSGAAEERFKLIAEAYHVLGERGRREDYDAWLDRHRRLSRAPELEIMAGKRPVRMPAEMSRMPRRPTRVSVRHAYERREERGNRRAAGRRAPARSIFMPRKGQPGVLRMVLVYVMALFMITPMLVRSCSTTGRRHAESVFRDKREPGVSPLDEQTQRSELERFRDRIRQAAQAGEPDAQFRYGCMLFHGYNGLPQDRPAAMQWFIKARDNGSPAAARLLRSLEKNKSRQGGLPPGWGGSQKPLLKRVTSRRASRISTRALRS